MVFCKVLSPFTEHVPGTGMVVGNAGATVNLPVRYAAQRRARGYVDYDDKDAEEAAVADAARPKSRKERLLLARSARRASETGQAAPSTRVPAPKAVAATADTKTAGRKPRGATRKPAATKPAPAAKSELGTLRAEYKSLTGKAPSPRLDAAGVSAKIAAFKAGGEIASPPSRPSRAKKAALASDAPVE